MKLKNKTRQENVNYMVDGITHIIKTFEKRPPGSKGERRQDIWRPSLKSIWIRCGLKNSACIRGLYGLDLHNRSVSAAFVCVFLVQQVDDRNIYRACNSAHGYATDTL